MHNDQGKHEVVKRYYLFNFIPLWSITTIESHSRMNGEIEVAKVQKNDSAN